MYNIGIRGVCLSLIKIYLQDRTQVLQVNGTKSLPIKTNKGVPQGSILWPLIFQLCTNDFLVLLAELIAYADDTAMLIKGDTWTQVAVTTSSKLALSYSWLYQNKLILNVQKSAFITYGNYSDSVQT